jgi:hypothetical protein
MNKITTIKDLKNALEAYPDDFQVIGICEGINENHVRTLSIEQAKGCIEQGKEFNVPLVHIVLDKNAAIAMLNAQQVILQKIEH